MARCFMDGCQRGATHKLIDRGPDSIKENEICEACKNAVIYGDGLSTTTSVWDFERLE
jgi:hypothetical protein